MVILVKNVRTKAGLLSAGADVTGKLSDETIADLIKSGLARDTGKEAEKVEPAKQEVETEEGVSGAGEGQEEDSVDLNLPDTTKKTTTTRSRGRKSK